MKRILYISILLTAAVFITSCGQQPGGLFYSIEQESEISNGKLADNITIGKIIRNNDYYFIAAGKFLYKSAAAGIDWPDADVNQNPTGYENYLCYDMALVGDTLYCVFYSKDGTDYRIFTTDTTDAASGLTWSELSFTNVPSAESIIAVEVLQNRFFIYTSTSTNLFNLYSTDASTISTASVFTQIGPDMNASGVLSIDYDGTDFWIAVGNKVFTSNSTNSSSIDVTSNITAKSSLLLGEGFSGILCADTQGDSNEEVYLTSEEGVLLMYNGTDWSVIANTDADATDGLFNPLYGLARVTVSNANENVDVILVGSSRGYYELNLLDSASVFVSAASVDTSLTIKNQFESIDLGSNIIQNFYFDSTAGNEIVFALCYNGGLWKNSLKYDGTSYYRFWDIE